MIPENLDLNGCNIVLITLDSLRWPGVAEIAKIPYLRKTLGEIYPAFPQSGYTLASHVAIYGGHIPTKIGSALPYYTPTARHPFRICCGPARDKGKKVGLLLQGNSIIEGLKKLGFYVFGTGGVSQFSTGSFLTVAYPWDKFTYYGTPMDEEPMEERALTTFPLSHIGEICENLKNRNQWFFFMNSPEFHYPYDYGEGIPKEILPILPNLYRTLSYRSLLPDPGYDKAAYEKKIADFDTLAPFAEKLKNMQRVALEVVDAKLNVLFDGLKSISQRPVVIIVCGDHGENFGETWDLTGKPCYGHLRFTKEVMTVPLGMGVL